MFMQKQIRENERGIAALTIVMLIGVLTLAVSGGIAFTVTRQIQRNRINALSGKALAVAEAGAEEVLLRIQRGEAVSSPLVLSVGDGTATVTYTTTGPQYDIVSEGNVNGIIRTMTVQQVLDDYDDVGFDFGVQIGDGGITFGNNAVINGTIHSNGNIQGASGVVTGDATVGAGLGGAPDTTYEVNDSDFLFATSSSNRDVAQSFTVGTSGELSQISVLLGKTGNPSDLTVHIAPDDMGEPENTPLASETLSEILVGGAPSWIDIGFSSPAVLTAGTTYWLVLDSGTSSMSDYWNWRLDSTDGYVGYTGLFDNNWDTGNPMMSGAGGDFNFRTWIGTAPTGISDITVGDLSSGEAHAQTFTNVTVHGAPCPNMWCIIESPLRLPLPVSDGAIADWKDDAAAGGVCAPPLCDAMGNLHVVGSQVLGPLVVTGNLTFDNNATLTISGTIYVQGDVTTSNNSTIQLDPAYQDLSGVLVTDGQVTVDNNSTFAGSGQPSSFVILLTTKVDTVGDVMTINNNSVGVIYYAQDGFVRLEQNATATQLTAYGVTMEENAVINYDALLAFSQVSPGPQSQYTITRWEETE